MTSLPVISHFSFHTNLENSAGPIKHNIVKGAHIRDFFCNVTAEYRCYYIKRGHLLIIVQNIYTNPLHIVVVLTPGMNVVALAGS